MPGFGGSQLFSEQVMNGGDGMTGQQSFRGAALGKGPRRRACFGVGLPIEQNIEEDIDVKQDPLHWYFAARCFRYSPRSAFLRDPRKERRTGVSRVAGEDGSATAER